MPAAGPMAWLWAVLIAMSLSVGSASAHIFDEEGIFAFLLGVSADETGTQNLHVLIVNNVPSEITLLGLTTDKGDRATIERTGSFLWLKRKEVVTSLRLKPAEQALMEPPDYFVTLPGVSASDLMAGRVSLVADFGPEGKIDVWPAGPLGGMLGSPTWEPTPFETLE